MAVPRKALVLAAGKSTRLRRVAPDVPKPLIDVGGRPVIEWNLVHLAEAGVECVWINLHYQGELIERAVGTGERFGLTIRYLREPEILGTAGSVKALERELGDGTFVVVYGDNLTSVDYLAMTRLHFATHALATLAVFDVRTTAHTGLAGGRVVVDETNRILGFEEGTSATWPLVNAGVYLLEPRIMAKIPSVPFVDFGRDVFPALIGEAERLQAYTLSGYCLAIDTPEALERARHTLAVAQAKAEVADS